MENTWGVLGEVVKRVTCKPGWTFGLDEALGMRLVIVVEGPDARREGGIIRVAHSFPVPVATYNRATWRRWVFDCCVKVEMHELGEWFLDGGERPYAPPHGPGEDPYTFHEFRPAVDARTNQQGEIG